MYKHTIKKIRENDYAMNCILGITKNNKKDYNHMIWMCDEIEKMTDGMKASRWIGYVCKTAEELGFWSNITSRDLIKIDILDMEVKSENIFNEEELYNIGMALIFKIESLNETKQEYIEYQLNADKSIDNDKIITYYDREIDKYQALINRIVQED